MTETVTLTADD